MNLGADWYAKGWNQRGDKKRMLETGSSFPPGFRAILEKAPEESLKVWTLLDLKVLPGWVNGNMALLGYVHHHLSFAMVINTLSVTPLILSCHIKRKEVLKLSKTRSL